MTAGIQNQNIGKVSSGYGFPSIAQVANATVEKTVEVANFMSDKVNDLGRAADFGSQWVDLSAASPDVKEKASRVKSAADRFNVVGAFCDMVGAADGLFRGGAIENLSDGIDRIGGYVGASMDFTGRLAGLSVISLGAAQPIADGAGAIADSLCGLNGARQALQDPDSMKSIPSTLLRVAKNVALAVFASIAGIASCFAKAVVGVNMPLYILIAGTTFLALKTASSFYDKLMLPRPQGLLAGT